MAIETGYRYTEFGLEQLQCPIHNCYLVGAGSWAQLECPNIKCSLKLSFNNNSTLSYLWHEGKEFLVEGNTFFILKKDWTRLFEYPAIDLTLLKIVGENMEKYLLL